MKYLFIKLLTLNFFFQTLITSSFIVSDKNYYEELAQKRLDSLYSKINSSENQIRWLTRTVSDQKKLITELKKSKNTSEKDKEITTIENEISAIADKKSNNSEDKQLDLITKQVILQSKLLELLGYKKEEQNQKTIPVDNSNIADHLIFLKRTIAQHTQDINSLKKTSHAPICKVVPLEKEIEIFRLEIFSPCNQNIFIQYHLLDEQVKLQAQLLTLLNFYK